MLRKDNNNGDINVSTPEKRGNDIPKPEYGGRGARVGRLLLSERGNTYNGTDLLLGSVKDETVRSMYYYAITQRQYF